jgi:hypothetical protein
MAELIPEAMKHTAVHTGITAGEEQRPVTGTTDSAAPVAFSAVVSPSPKAGQSSFQSGFESIPVDPHDSGGPA